MHRTRVLAVATLAGALSAGVACTNSGLGMVDTAADLPPVEPPACAWEGTWVLDDVQCNGFAVAAWGDLYDEVVMTLAEAEEGCTGTLTWSGPECGEEEVFTVVPPESTGDVDFVGGGVTVCETEGCSFGTVDAEACAVGARAETRTVHVNVDALAEGVLVFDDLGRHAYPSCDDEVAFTTTWTKR